MRTGSVFLACLALAACKADPKEVTLGDYRYTLGPGWQSSQSEGKGYKHSAFDAFAYDGSCVVEVFSVPVKPEDYVAQMEKTFVAKGSKPATFTTTAGVALAGSSFEGEVPANTPMASLARLAGTPAFEIYAGKDGEAVLGMMIMTLGNEEDKAAARKQCAAILSSMRRVSAKPAAPAK